MTKQRVLSPASTIFWASFLGLFLELALIRWVSSEVRVFAYCKNLVLVASFLGFGTGCFLWRRRIDLVRTMLVLLILTLTIGLPWQSLEIFGPRRVSDILARLQGFMIFYQDLGSLPGSDLGRLAFAVGWTSVLFFVVAFVMIPFGQIVAAGIARFENPIRAYSTNVAGSLTGMISFTLLSRMGAPPLVWFVPVCLASLLFSRTRREAQRLLGLSLALTLVLLPHVTPAWRTLWSPYQKLELIFQPGVRGNDDSWHIRVNNTGFQNLLRQPSFPADPPVRIDRFTMPYMVRPEPGRVLVVGAGGGNDVVVALRVGAASVIAVEIDPKIYELGRDHHPQSPYDDPRVEVVIDDGRHYLKTTEHTFDTVVFSHLDSHTLLSSYTNVRLDNYIHTVEAFQEARSRLAPGGILYVSYFAHEPFVAARLSKNLDEAFGHPPVSLRTLGDHPVLSRFSHFLTGEEAMLDRIKAVARTWSNGYEISNEEASPVLPSTDDWPFLRLERRQIPPFVALVSVVILALSLAFAWRARPAGAAFDGRIFFLGAAFLLLETHNVSRLALVFGTTWRVNAWVIGAILGLILLANAVFLGLERRGKSPGRWAVGGLFVSLLAAWLVPIALFLGLGLAGKIGATLLLSAPVFFAGLVFAEAFAASPAPGFALGWNVLGAVGGGLAESFSYVWGLPALVPLAAAFYLAAVVWRGSTSQVRR